MTATAETEVTESQFREDARRWLEANASLRDSPEVVQDLRPIFHRDRLSEGYAFHRKLWEAGFSGITWPKEYGGRGLGAEFQSIWNEESATYAIPRHGNGAALHIAAPMLLAHASEYLKRRHVPRILAAEECWCQFLSEPGGGSDLAGLRTRAVRDGDEWLITGSKIWTTGAHFSTHAMCLARTNPDVPKHQGLTMFVVDIPSPGLEIRPLTQITGEVDFNQEFLDDVRVPAANVIGEVDNGWRVAQTMLGFERSGLGGGWLNSGSMWAGSAPHQLADLARHRGATDAHVKYQLGDVWVRNVVLARTAARAQSGEVSSPFWGSALKVMSTDVTRREARTAMAIAGEDGVYWAPEDENGDRWARALLSARAAGIGGGTDEVHRNIVGERMIGLDREPQVDRDIPFRDIPGSRRA
jgi:alkylation response protein AidB-like acyl-CoA dehydrogenase